MEAAGILFVVLPYWRVMAGGEYKGSASLGDPPYGSISHISLGRSPRPGCAEERKCPTDWSYAGEGPGAIQAFSTHCQDCTCFSTRSAGTPLGGTTWMLRASSSSASVRFRFLAMAGTWCRTLVCLGRSCPGSTGGMPSLTKRRRRGSKLHPFRRRSTTWGLPGPLSCLLATMRSRRRSRSPRWPSQGRGGGRYAGSWGGKGRPPVATRSRRAACGPRPG